MCYARLVTTLLIKPELRHGSVVGGFERGYAANQHVVLEQSVEFGFAVDGFI